MEFNELSNLWQESDPFSTMVFVSCRELDGFSYLADYVDAGQGMKMSRWANKPIKKGCPINNKYPVNKPIRQSEVSWSKKKPKHLFDSMTQNPGQNTFPQA